MNRMIEDRRLGSLLDDREYMAEYIRVARSTGEVTVWCKAKARKAGSSAAFVSALPSECLRGRYGMDEDVVDIHDDLPAFRNERVSKAMVPVFDPGSGTVV